MEAISTSELIAIVIPLAILELSLKVWAFIDIARRDRVKGGSKLVWVLIVLVINLVGPILYLVWGRND